MYKWIKALHSYALVKKETLERAFTPFILSDGTPTNYGFGWFIGGIIAGLMLAVIVFFPFWLSWYFSLYIMTDQRFIQISQKSMFNKSVVDIILSQVQMVNYEIAGLQETLLGFGTIMIQTYVGELVIKDVHHPSKIQKAMLKILRDNGLSPNTVSPFVKQENVSAEEP